MSATLRWYGCTTYRFDVAGTVVWLDAYIDRVHGADGPPGATAAGVTEADWIVIGHSHIDHLWGAETIALNTGATIIGSYETRRIMRVAGVPDEQLIAVAGGERIPLSDEVTVRVIPAMHSCWWAGYDDAHPDSPCIGGADLDYFQRQHIGSENIASAIAAMSAEGQAHVVAATEMTEGDGGVFAYLFETPQGTLFFKDTPGHWSGLLERESCDVAILGVSGQPQIDGETHQGPLSAFVIDECRMLGARRMIPSHHDDYMPGLSGPFGTAELTAAVEASCSTEFVDLGYEPGYRLFEGLRP